MGLETSDSWMNHIARNEIYFGKAVSLEEISRGVQSVSREELVVLARELFRPEAMALTLLGDLKEDFKAKSLDLKR